MRWGIDLGHPMVDFWAGGGGEGEVDLRLGVLVQLGNRFVSFVRAMRSCVCLRDDVALNAGWRKLQTCSVHGASFPRALVAVYVNLS